MDINGKIIVITGAGSGMGAETAIYLQERGARVAVIDINLAAAEKIAGRIGGLAIQCDVTNPDEANHALDIVNQGLGTPQVLINCAGIAPAGRILGREGPMPLDDFRKAIEINLVGSFNMLRLVAERIAKHELTGQEEQGVIINTASVAAFEGQIGQCAYSASKGGICALTLPAARELARFGIRVMTIAPGLIDTPLFDNFSNDIQASLASQVPFPKRLGRPIEFAMLVEQIIQNPYLNGEVIRLDGAIRMQPK
jgi:NAD(P)-dependent dehydrogenase (short-subunit alcohol dehydrogenase family)